MKKTRSESATKVLENFRAQGLVEKTEDGYKLAPKHVREALYKFYNLAKPKFLNQDQKYELKSWR